LNDKDRLDFLDAKRTGYGGGWVLRKSETGKGMRLHETWGPWGGEGEIVPKLTVREAIDDAIRREIEQK
jgi:hypothetical protein